MDAISTPGLIFISHSSSDKDFVEKVIRSIPKSHLFYDTDTINPGHHTTDQLDDGLLICSVFVMFVSPDTEKSAWVDYESGVAYVQKIKRSNISIVAIPIKGATYRDAPEWMQKYMAVPSGYSHADIARLIKSRYEDVLKIQGVISVKLFVGREDLCSKIIVESRTRSAESGIPVNFLVLAGIPNMGRFSVAQNIVGKIYPGARNDMPIFEIPKNGDAVDLFLALRQDITGLGELSWYKEQIRTFPSEADEQATVLMASLGHFSNINQTVVVKSAYGLRNQSRTLKPWVQCLFEKLRAEPNVRIVWISDRLLAPESLDSHPNVMQFQIPELTEDHIVFLLTELLDVTSSSPAVLRKIAPHVHGHPGSAHYVASLIKNSQRAPESLLDKPDSIRLFQEDCVRGAISGDVIGELGQNIILLLKLLPSADYTLISQIFSDYPATDLAQTLWDMTDNCIVSYTMTSGYRLADIVRPIAIGSGIELPTCRLESLSDILVERLQSPDARLLAIEALLSVSVRRNGAIPPELHKVLTGGTLHDLVEQYYQMGHRMNGNWQENFRIAARLALLASNVPIASDTLENILFNGADSLVRIGEDPAPITRVMQAKKFPSVNYILGSYYYHKMKDIDSAIQYLEVALQAGSYVKRTGRLLARAYMEKGLPRAGLDVFRKLGDRRVNRDTGLLAQKIRCLRACGQHAEANQLVLAMRSLDDEVGEYDVLTAAKCMSEGKFDAALEAVARAGSRAKVNRINLRLLETAIRIEMGDYSGLDDTCKMAIAIGLDNGSNSLRARASIKQGRWKDAETELDKIQNKNYYDKLLQLRAAGVKLRDMEVIADPVLFAKSKARHEQLLVELKRDGDGEWSYDP